MKASIRAAAQRRLRYNPLNRTDAERIKTLEAGAARREEAARRSDYNRNEILVVNELIRLLKERSGS